MLDWGVERSTNTDYIKITIDGRSNVRSQSNVGENIKSFHRILDFSLSLNDCLDHTGSPIGNGCELTGIIVNLGIVKDMDFKGISSGLP